MDFTSKIVKAVNKCQTFGQSTQGSGIMHIGYGFDAAYVRPMGVSLTSIAVNNPNINIHAHLFYSSLGNGDLIKFERMVECYPHLSISLYNVDDQIIKMLPVKRYLPLATYFRLMMPNILTEIDKMLYLDSDVLCLGDIAEIMELDLNDKTAFTISDVNFIASKRIEALSLNLGKYFNAGIMLINIKKWNAQNISEKAFSLLCKTPDKFSFLDQDVLNIVLENDTQYIDKKWNFVLTSDNIPSDVKFLHCVSHPKPWKIFCQSKSQSLFLHYESLSPWSGSGLDDPTTYREARQYARFLFNNGSIKEALIWYKTYLIMKLKTKLRH